MSNNVAVSSFCAPKKKRFPKMALKENGQTLKNSYLSPIPAVKDFFECLGELKNLSKNPSQAGRLASILYVGLV